MYQKLIFIGNLGRDPEMRYLPDGTAVTNFSVATNRSWTDSRTGESKDETTWFRVSVWGRQAEACNQYLQKGRRVLVEGTLKSSETGGPILFTRQDGTVSSSFEVNAQNVRFLGGGAEAGDTGTDDAWDAPGATQDEDDIPF